MPDIYKDVDTVTAYRNYYVGKKQGYFVVKNDRKIWRKSTWTKRGMPEWFSDRI